LEKDTAIRVKVFQNSQEISRKDWNEAFLLGFNPHRITRFHIKKDRSIGENKELLTNRSGRSDPRKKERGNRGKVGKREARSWRESHEMRSLELWQGKGSFLDAEKKGILEWRDRRVLKLGKGCSNSSG